ncbi:unnamed protein product [Gulo gulo]|uniref:Uncharacterized protein n=1 Tax=Gulo gulo TaxID=48420 RepID=A0A9X9LK34_GULGU|nr:unnamed protein product [Gulo gulo]
MWWLSLAHWVWAQFQNPFWAEALPLVQVMVQLLPQAPDRAQVLT